MDGFTHVVLETRFAPLYLFTHLIFSLLIL